MIASKSQFQLSRVSHRSLTHVFSYSGPIRDMLRGGVNSEEGPGGWWGIFSFCKTMPCAGSWLSPSVACLLSVRRVPLYGPLWVPFPTKSHSSGSRQLPCGELSGTSLNEECLRSQWLLPTTGTWVATTG